MYKQRIIELLNDMEVLLVRFTRIKREGFDRVKFGLDTLSDDDSHLKALFDFLMEFRTNEFAELHRIFRLPLDSHSSDAQGCELWSRYFTNGKTNLIEMRLFRAGESMPCGVEWLPKDY